ncbi:hypothetical protein AJ79_06894 [Helicocarpus griseus UAMH5409]|uniref:Cwf19-like C-terminal domain-containing protein n=1 Tax=Helicocarpus griseus UAMH5409 TaxID=1447875 RepID=A0A2B7X8M2_9EURO|nr:hypothetical protein AJ79_06894 [Helicocarpus griseus UAMH5409]
MASKIIIVGSVNCSIKDVFTKLAKLQTKQNFAFAIIAGDLFGEGSSEEELNDITGLLNGTITVPLPTYFTVGNHAIPTRIAEKIESDDEVCTNLYFLGRRGTLKTSEGIRIVALGGNLEGSANPTPGVNDKYEPRYTESDARSLFGAHSADILITNQWPKSILDGSKVPLPEGAKAPEGMPTVADICATLKPRYHFSSNAPFFYEREPFFHLPTEESPDVKQITRFINVAPFSKTSNQKWLYAFTLDPKAPPLMSIPAGATASPLLFSRKRRAFPNQQQSFSRFAQGDDYSRPTKRARRPPPGPSECFFCLSNPNIATHLITSIGSDCYLTTAKGPLPTSTTFRSLGFPGHMLIIPLTHAPTFDAITDADAKSSTLKEMQRYRSALHTMLHERSNGELGAVTWEVSRGNGIHIHWQFLPVPSDLISRGLVEVAFKVEAENLSYPKFEKTSTEDIDRGDYFRVMIWSPSKNASNGEEKNESGSETTLVLPLSPDFRFDLQFGRRVMAKLLQLENRMNWKDDVQSQEEETVDAEAFKKAFEKFDFSLEE